MDKEKVTGQKIEFSKVSDLFRKFGLLFVIIIMITGMSIFSSVFLTSGNILNVLRQVSINGILAAGMTFVILTGGIDLSVGSVIAVTGVISGGLMVGGHSPTTAILVGLLAGLLFGAFNGISIAYFGLPPFIATLASQTIGRGFALVYSDGKPYSISNTAFLNIGKGSVLGIPIPVWILIIVCIVAYIVLNYTNFGRYVYAIGGNENAAKLSGVKTKNIKMATYIIAGLLSSVAAIILASRISSGQPTSGEGYELDAIAAVAIGGTSMTGGVGSLGGTIMGFIIIGVLGNSLTLLNVSSFYQQIVKGSIIMIAVLLDMRTKKMSK